MAIESKSIVGGAVALALVGAVMWGFTVMFSPPAKQPGSVEVTQLSEPSWAVEVKQLGDEPSASDARTASR
jgi:hypothetical protein